MCQTRRDSEMNRSGQLREGGQVFIKGHGSESTPKFTIF